MMATLRVASLVLALALPALSSAAADVLLTDSELSKVLRHGPWPPDPVRDPSNRVSGDPRAIALGRILFSDSVLSIDQNMTCTSCHQPDRNFTDGRARAEGRERLDRNTQALWNLTGQRWFGWSGDTDSLWAQNLTPILNPLEMGHSATSLQNAILLGPRLQAYEAVFGEIATQTPVETAVNISKALAAYIETLWTGRTSFDDFRDDLVRRDFAAAGRYPKSAQRGLKIFLGPGNCAFCHSGPAFTNGEFHDAGVPYFLEPGRVDAGRADGIENLTTSHFTLDGIYSDDPEKTGAWAVRNVRFQHSNFGIFRVPTLRRTALTAPYMHNGSLPDLAAVIQHYNNIDMERLHTDGEAILKPLGLTTDEVADLEAFLRTLSDD